MSFMLRWLISCRMYDSMSWLTCGQGPASGPSDPRGKTCAPSVQWPEPNIHAQAEGQIRKLGQEIRCGKK